MEKVHLISNAHLDPVWMWEWEEGAAEVLSTFRSAADLCEEYGGYIFNHNEVILYQWVEEYEPKLFRRIQKLVREGKWHIMGGWYLQPDCNMPSGESFVRQILTGRTYFREKFNVEPTTAINFDPFGHTRGLVQILRKSGYNSYLFCRPTRDDCSLPSDDFIWVGYDGSEVMAHRSSEFYNSPKGKAADKIQKWLGEVQEHSHNQSVGLILWGVGNHGGGPSRKDLNEIGRLMKETEDTAIVHSTPEAFFQEMQEHRNSTPRHEGDLNSWAVGCYTSQIRLKQKHRLLENEIYMSEKMLSQAAMQGLLLYPKAELDEAVRDLMMAEFHDILPGSSVQPVEEASLRLMDHGLEMISRLRAKAFFALSGGQSKAGEGETPILIYNPHPHSVEGVFECEFQLPDQNWAEEFSNPIVYRDGVRLPSQPEKEFGNVNLDWRKRVVFRAELTPGQMNRFDCKLETLPKKPSPQLEAENGFVHFRSDELEVMINCETGLMDEYKANGVSYLKKNAFLPQAIDDNDDPWKMTVHEWGITGQSFSGATDSFQLMSKEEGTRFSGVKGKLLDSVRVIEDGEVRTVIEAVMSCGDSFIVQTYKLPKKGTEVEVQVRVHWNEKTKMLKLSIPTVMEDGRYMGQVAYGMESLPVNGKEVVSQKWAAAVSESRDIAFSCINDGIYGSDFQSGEIRLSLLRSPLYAAHPILNRPMAQEDRYSPRIDQGERLFRFWFNGSAAQDRIRRVNREALVWNEKPAALSFFPSGEDTVPLPLAVLSDDTIVLTAFKRAEASDSSYIIRLFEPTGQRRTTFLTIATADIRQELQLEAFEIRTLRLDMAARTLIEVGLMETELI